MHLKKAISTFIFSSFIFCITHTQQNIIYIEISYGELIDKITILEIKAKRISNPEKLLNVRNELETLNKTFREQIEQSDELLKLKKELKMINEKLWGLEDDIRAKERDKEFGIEFIQLARLVYIINDERGRIKRAINKLLGSRLIEEKEYTKY